MVFVTAKVNFIPVAFALTCVSSVALATTAPTKKSGTDKISHPAARTAPDAGNAHSKSVNARREELLVVSSSRAPNGVSNTTPGGGLLPIQTAPRLQSGVTRDYIAKQAQTSNALSLLQMSPGAVVGSADPLGLSDHAGISVRGMDVSELGLVFEGMPAGDPIYGIADTAEWADTENISRIDLTQGSSDIATPSYSAVGGQISAQLRNPSKRRGGFLELSGGTHATNKDFLRFDTGELGRSGVYAFVSGSYTQNDNWRGPGTNRRYHVDAKLTKSWGEGSHTAAVFTWNTVDESPTRYLSLSQWQRYGRSYNYAGQYTPGSTDYYRQFQYDRTSVMISAPTHFRLTNNLSADVTPYYQWMSGSVPSATTLTPGKIYYGNESAGTIDFPTVYNGKAAVAAIAGSNSYNTGFTGNLALHTGINTLRVGYWYGNLNKNSLYDYAPVSSSGNIMDDTIRTQSGAVLATKNFHLMQQVNGFYIEDTLSLLDHRLDITAGFKEVLMSRSGTNNIPGATYSWSTNTATPLPRMSVSYKITPQDTVFFNASTGFHAPASDVPYYDAFNMSTGKLSTRGRTDLKNEYAISEELGFRHTGLVNVSVGLFNYNFTNRQVSSSVYVDGALTTNFINAGGQTTRGAQAEVALRPWHHFSPYVSGQYLHATLDNNLAVGNDYLPTKGKTAIMSPKFTASIGISYDDGQFFGNLYFNYVDSQYSTFMNDESIPAYKTANATLGYRMKSFGFLHSPQIMVNLINIGDSNYLSGIYSAKTNAKTTRGIYGTSIAGSSPTYYLGGGFATVVGISTGF
ncbi:TonB-dependent receptor [Acetobacter suratthaniensis]|uniref:TonB-dependent receptor n=1 Tax=Acetobacter suratthaniensis TaxID=1502841 RepID=A0ABS3LPS7_9PROT|nr:TonB-dependent receptor [Acetobacter suratthaniensis]MBO1329376.1 TonB-dependent receptor [Acetobacter suratthaniensis]MCX2567465.1 TonB-dependent receptor [Acetobacter suratthaniensis]